MKKVRITRKGTLPDDTAAYTIVGFPVITDPETIAAISAFFENAIPVTFKDGWAQFELAESTMIAVIPPITTDEPTPPR